MRAMPRWDHTGGGETLITVELHEDGAGTRLVMRHEGLPTEKARDEHLSGWSSCYDRLVEMFS